MANKISTIKTREELIRWFEANSKSVSELFLPVKRGKPLNNGKYICYLDAVEVALCFGWIDSTTKSVDGVLINRFTPRRPNSPWTELNKERCRRLIKLGEMREEGYKVLPNLDDDYVYPNEVINELKKDKEAYDFFLSTPKLYQKIRIYNVMFYFSKDKKQYSSALNNLVSKCHDHKMYGEWSDYGRLLSY